MDSPQPGMLPDVKFNFDELAFLLDDSASARVVMYLLMLEWQFRALRQTVDLRAEALAVLHSEMAANPVVPAPSPESIKVIYSGPYQKLAALTKQIIASVDAGLVAAKDTNAKLQSALQTQFPGQSFLQFKLVDQSASVATSRVAL